MWRRPLAYGHATATRIFLGASARLKVANDMDASLENRAPDPSHARERRRTEKQAEEEAHPRDVEGRIRRETAHASACGHVVARS
jgi:hypothetical protein